MRKINRERIRTQYYSIFQLGNYILQYEDPCYNVWKKEPGKLPKSKSSKLKKTIYAGGGVRVNQLHCSPYQYQIACTDQEKTLVKVIDLEKESIEMTFACDLSQIVSFYGECIQNT
jgi:hypothetical protein